MHPTAAANLTKLLATITAILNSSSSAKSALAYQAILDRIQSREPEILIQLLEFKNSSVQIAVAAVLSDLLQDPDPLTRQNTIRYLFATRTTAYLKPLTDYLQRANSQVEIRSAARITSRVAYLGPSQTTACVQHNTVLIWRLMSLLNNAQRQS